MDLSLKLEQTGSGTDKFVAEIYTTSSGIVLNVFAEVNGKQTNIESKLSLKFVNKVDSGSIQFRLGITNDFSINENEYTYRGIFITSVPQSISNNDIASKFINPLKIVYKDSFREDQWYDTKPKPYSDILLFKLQKHADRLQAVLRFGAIKVVISTKANPYDSIASLVNKIYEINGLHNCDLTGLVFARNPANFIRQNKDNQVCIRATFFPDEMLDVLDRQYGLNCDTVFSRENIDLNFSSEFLGYYGWIYPETAISLCKHSVAEIKEKASAIRNFLFASKPVYRK